MIAPAAISALVLAGGRGQRMGGADKGLLPFDGQPLAQRALDRLRAQTLPPAVLAISANRHLPAYRALGVPVWSDADTTDAADTADAGADPAFDGPLAGWLSAMRHVRTPWLLSVPCDVPHFPLSLCERLARAAASGGADVAVAATPQRDAAGQPVLRRQPVFCLLRVAPLRAPLAAYLRGGGRRVGEWLAGQGALSVPFEPPHAAPGAFDNANTPHELARLQATAPAGAGAHPPQPHPGGA